MDTGNKKEQKTFKIGGMHCASCSALIEKTLSKTEGVNLISVNLATNTGKIEYDNSLLSFSDIEKRIKGLGYNVVKEDKRHETRGYLIRFIAAMILSVPITISMFFDVGRISEGFLKNYNLLTLILGVVVVFGAGSNFHLSFLLKLRRLQFNMDSLISIGSLTALLYSIGAFFSGRHFHHFLEGANFIITFILLGKFLEARSKGKASEALQKLFELKVKKAIVLRDGKEEEIDIDNVERGETLIVKAGEKIPLDGIIEEGGANIDESMLTGESIPVYKEASREVFAATFVLDGMLKIKVTGTQHETLLSKIIQMVEETQTRKAPIQYLADRVAGVFVPIIMGISFCTFVVWYFISNGDLSIALLPAVAVLVIACPCALGLATPTAIIVATGKGAQQGIIIKDGESFEKAGKIEAVIFDKTGTLTKGEPVVTDVIPINISKNAVIEIVLSLTSMSNHPLSKAINKYFETTHVKDEDIESFKEIPGKGLEGILKKNNKTVRIGNDRYMKENDIKFNEDASSIVEKLSTEGKSLLFFAVDDELSCIFCIMDLPKDNASRAIKDLRLLGKDVYMITGDSSKTANSIGKSIGIDKDKIIAGVLPNEKANQVTRMQRDGKKVAFVGDGINDAPALAAADIGIAIGTGSEIAIETGGIVLVKGDPQKVVTALKLSIKTYRIIKQNLFWAFFYNLIGVPLAAFGIMPPVFASLAMSFSSVSVVTNSLRIKRR